jgi:hypothetical protein
VSRTWPAIAAAALAIAGCGAPAPEEAVAVAERWVDAVAEDRGGDACRLMLPSAIRSLRDKYLDDRGGSCEAIVRAYGAKLPDAKLRALREQGLEFNGEVKKGRIGVFPTVARYELEILLMQRDGEAWKLASVGISP